MALTITKIEPADMHGNVIGTAITDIPEPSTYVWGKSDISGQGAGRTITTDAWKNLKAKARTLRMTWVNKDRLVVSKALQAFDHEYAWITYMDALTGQYERKHFYLGADMSSTMYTMHEYPTNQNVMWSVASIEIIQAITDKV